MFTSCASKNSEEKEPAPGPAHSERLQRLEVTTSTVRFVESVRQTMQLMHLLSFV